jgi:hypothetical protein
MSICATCGRPRNGTARFCGTCGAEFSDPPATPEDQWAPPADATRFDPPMDVTRMDAVAGATRADPAAPAAAPDPFASWFQQGAQGPEARGPEARGPEAQGGAAWGFRNDADTNWQPTQTVRPTPTGPTGYPPLPPPFTPQGPPPFTPPGPPFPPTAPPARSGRRGLFVVLAIVVVLAAGGGAYALATTLGKHPNAQPSAPATVSASTPAVSSPPAGTTQPASPTPAASASTSPSTSPTPSPALSLVAISPGISSAAVPAVELLLSRHFQGINTLDYAEYVSGLTPQDAADQPQSNFDSGYQTTKDSGMTLTSLSSTGSGLAATVTFTSQQAPADSVDNSACNSWTITYYLVPSGTGYLIGPAPPGAPKATYSDC